MTPKIEYKGKTCFSDSGINEEKMPTSQLGILFEENASLRKRLSQEMEMNRELCSYDEKRQEYVDQLRDKISHLKNKVDLLQKQVINCCSDSGSSDGTATGTPVSKKEFLDLQLSYENSVKRNCSLEKVLNETKTKLGHLQNQLEFAQNQYAGHKKILEFQLRSHKDDLQAESIEKGKVKKKCKQLSKFVEHLKNELKNYKENFEVEKAGKSKAEKDCQHLKCQLADLQKNMRLSEEIGQSTSNQSKKTQESTSSSSPISSETAKSQVQPKAICSASRSEDLTNEVRKLQRTKSESSSLRSTYVWNDAVNEQMACMMNNLKISSIPTRLADSKESSSDSIQSTVKLSGELCGLEHIVEEHIKDGYLVCPSCFRVFDLWRLQELEGHYEACKSRIVLDSTDAARTTEL